MSHLFDTDSGPTCASRTGTHSQRRQRPLVLMVDDDPDDRGIYGDMLGYNGYDVIMAGTVKGAIQCATDHAPDLILLDLGLPDGSGFDVCAALLRGLKLDMPVIALSAFPRSQQSKRADEYGCATYIEKPASPVRVLHHIEQLIGRAPLPGVGRPPRVTQPSDV